MAHAYKPPTAPVEESPGTPHRPTFTAEETAIDGTARHLSEGPFTDPHAKVDEKH